MKLRSIAQISEPIRRGDISPIELTRDCLDRIEGLNSTLNAFITVTTDSALAEAQRAETEIRSGNWRGPLHGIPIGLKDLIDTAGARSTAGSAVFKDRIPAQDADVVVTLRAAGAVILGKQNLHEFAYGGSSLVSHFGPVRNPVNPEFIAGGSSGGPAAAVASGMCYAAIGTDTAGSIREPAALCGVVGLKPTYGLVSTRGIIPLSHSLDHAGPITRTVEDAAIVLAAIAGSSADFRADLKAGVKGLRVGIPRTFFFDELNAEIASSVEQAIAEIAKLGAELHDIQLTVDTDRTLQAYESYQFHREMVAATPDLYQPETMRRIRSGEKTTDEQYEVARRQLESERSQIAELFHKVDVFVTPTTPIPAPRISDLVSDPAQLRPAELLLLRNTRPINVWGLPAISLPCGVASSGLPIGLQIVGPPGGEADVLRLASQYEQCKSL